MLLSWLLNPGTAVYAGYTDSRQNVALLSGSPNNLSIIGPPSTTIGREIFIKVSYLFRR